MRPVRTPLSNFVYMGNRPEVQDLHCQRLRVGVVRSVWWLTPVEREAIATGANVALTVLTEPIPPVMLEVTTEQGQGEDAPEVLERLIRFAGEQQQPQPESD